MIKYCSSFLSIYGRNEERILLSGPNRTITIANTVYKAPSSNSGIKLNGLGTGSFKKPGKALLDLLWLGMHVNPYIAFLEGNIIDIVIVKSPTQSSGRRGRVQFSLSKDSV